MLPFLILKSERLQKDELDPYSKKELFRSFAEGVVLSVIVLSVFILLKKLIPVLENVSPSYPEALDEFNQPLPGTCRWKSWWDVLAYVAYKLVSIVVLEELFFRGFVQKHLSRIMKDSWQFPGAKLGIGWLMATAMFAIPHMFAWKNPLGLMTFFLGLLFGYLFARRQNIVGATVFHTACNVVPPISAWVVSSHY